VQRIGLSRGAAKDAGPGDLWPRRIGKIGRAAIEAVFDDQGLMAECQPRDTAPARIGRKTPRSGQRLNGNAAIGIGIAERENPSTA
jgi:hypothetical protein